MKKVNVQGLCDGFKGQIAALKTFHTDACGSLTSHPQHASHESTLAEIIFHRACVFLEAFISEYFIGCVNRQSAHYLAFRRNSMFQSLESKFSQWDISHTRYSPPQNIPVAQVRSLLDASDKNIAFKDYATMEQHAQEWLAPVYYAKIAGVTPDRKQILDVAKKIRNCIAHRSAESFREMNQTIMAIRQTGSVALLRRSVNSINKVGAYLKAAQPGINSRVEFFLDEFGAFAHQLR